LDEGDIADLQSAFFSIFFMAGKFQSEFEFPECLDRDFYYMGTCKMVVPFTKIGYIKDSEPY